MCSGVRKFLEAVKRLVGPRGRAIFRSCPRGAMRIAGRRGCSNGGGCDEPFRRELAELGWELFDVFRVTEALWSYIDATCEQPGLSKNAKHAACEAAWKASFADNVHFQCHVYREFNRVFVAGLG